MTKIFPVEKLQGRWGVLSAKEGDKQDHSDV